MSSRHSYFVCFILSFGFVGRLDGVVRGPSRSDADARPGVYGVTPEAVKNTEQYRTDVRLSPWDLEAAYAVRRLSSFVEVCAMSTILQRQF